MQANSLYSIVMVSLVSQSKFHSSEAMLRSMTRYFFMGLSAKCVFTDQFPAEHDLNVSRILLNGREMKQKPDTSDLICLVTFGNTS